MTIHINVKDKENPESDIAVSGTYNGTVWLNYAEQRELAAFFLVQRKGMIEELRRMFSQ
jgi:hypothetical protein